MHTRTTPLLTLAVLPALFLAACEETPPSDAGPSDAGASDAGPVDEPVCASFGGLYQTDTDCNGAISLEPICVRQTSCEVSVWTPFFVYTGTADDERASFAPQDPGPTCTLAPGDPGFDLTCEQEGDICIQEAERIDTAGKQPCCDVVAQDCGDELRCHVVRFDNINTTACIDSGGDVDKGASCERAEVSTGGDDCAAGLFCANWGSASATQRTCHALCDDGDDCAAGEACNLLSSAPPAGACSPSCSPFAGATDACPAGAMCALSRALDGPGFLYTTVCVPPNGDAIEGEACFFGNDCVDGLGCVNGTCARFCDDEHPCPQGQTCGDLQREFVSPVPAGFGKCE